MEKISRLEVDISLIAHAHSPILWGNVVGDKSLSSGVRLEFKGERLTSQLSKGLVGGHPSCGSCLATAWFCFP